MSDPCECFFDHESAMQRLLAMLRNSQSDCTDTGCENDGIGGGGSNPMVMWTLLWTFMAMALYVMRPNSMRSDRRNQDAAVEKPSSSGHDNTPPPPPPSAM